MACPLAWAKSACDADARTLFPVELRETPAFPRPSKRDSKLSRDSDSSRGSDESSGTPRVPMDYPMYLMSWKVLMGMDRMVPHQALKDIGRLTEWCEELWGLVLLVSHEWLGYSDPDPAGEKLAVMKGSLERMASGRVAIESDWRQHVMNQSSDRLEEKHLASVIQSCYFWLDYASIPQPLATAQKAAQPQDVMSALRSMPAYVERSAALLVLAPTCQHRDVSDRESGFASWRGRGWCRLELCTALLSRARVRIIRCIAAAAAPEFMYINDALFLPPGLGAYTCCDRKHWIDGVAIECDKARLAPLVSGILDAAAESLHRAGDTFRRRVLLCSRARLLQGLPQQQPAPGPEAVGPNAADVRDFKLWLKWRPKETETARHFAGSAPSLVHWAALAGNARVITALLALDRRELDSPMPLGAPEFGIEPLLSPLHLAAFSSDGKPSAMEALLAARADAEKRDGARQLLAPMHAARCGTPQHLRAWMRRFPAWRLERRDPATGATVLTVAAAEGPKKAELVASLLALGADPRAACGDTAPLDAALLAACAKEDSDPELVALLLEAGCSPAAVHDPPWLRWRALCATTRWAVRWAGLRGRVPGPAAAVLADAVGSTPLHFAARNGHTAVMRVLLQARADPALRNAMGRTALDSARLRFGGQAPAVVAALLAERSAEAAESTGPPSCTAPAVVESLLTDRSGEAMDGTRSPQNAITEPGAAPESERPPSFGLDLDAVMAGLERVSV